MLSVFATTQFDSLGVSTCLGRVTMLSVRGCTGMGSACVPGCMLVFSVRRSAPARLPPAPLRKAETCHASAVPWLAWQPLSFLRPPARSRGSPFGACHLRRSAFALDLLSGGLALLRLGFTRNALCSGPLRS